MIHLGVLSKHRSVCMGIGIVFVLMVHALNFGYTPYHAVVQKIMSYGQIGVNIFFLMSGLGMYFALQKKPTTGQFLKRRFSRLFIPYLLLAPIGYFILDVIFDHNGVLWLYDLSTLSFWFSDRGLWYLSVTVVLYLMIPFHHMLCQRHKSGVVNSISILISLMIAAFLLPCDGIFLPNLGLLFERIAVFIAGYWMAEAVQKDYSIPIVLPFLLIATVALKSPLHLPKTNILINITLAAAGLGICCLAGWICENNLGNKMMNSFDFLGQYTLEIYILNGFGMGICGALSSLWEPKISRGGGISLDDHCNNYDSYSRKKISQ